MLEVPNTKPIELVMDTSLVPLLERDTAPVKLLLAPLVDKLIPLAPALKLDMPGTTNAPVWLIAPLDTIVKFCPTVEAANEVAMLLVKVTLLDPLLDKVIAPVKLLLAPLVVKSIVLAPALKLDVPVTDNVPVCEIAPPAIALKLPLIEAAGKVIAALLNSIVKLRKLVIRHLHWCYVMRYHGDYLKYLQK
jgi:hypothetical protein